MSKETGGPAFPNTVKITDEGFAELRGMTLRDYFAAKAMQGIYSCPVQLYRADGSPLPEIITSADIAKMAYEEADEMLKARGK